VKLLRKLIRRARGERSFQEKASGIARRWSNKELRKFAHLFPGAAVNVSAWEDRDKQGGCYKDYFTGANSYHITNFGTDQGVLQHTPNEIFLDLEQDLDAALRQRFSTVFNHTTLEHVWDFRKAFANLCAMSSDIVIVVLPWLQPLHSNYGDYWRFSPQAAVRLFEEQGFKMLHLGWNADPSASVYVMAIASRHPERWMSAFPSPPCGSEDPNFLELPTDFAGRRAFG
jgi:hypothetical protein